MQAWSVPVDWDIWTSGGVYMQSGGVHAHGMYALQVHTLPHQAAFSFSCLPLRRDAFAAEVRAHFFPNVSVDLCESNHCCFPHLPILIIQQLADGWHCLGQVKTSGAIPVPGKVQQVLMRFVRVCFHSCTTTWRLSQN